jgi:hypothetical protein
LNIMEKRACERIPVDIDVKFYCCNRTHDGRVKNISEKGMFIVTCGMVSPFDSELEVIVPFHEEELRIPAHLRRIEADPGSRDGIGVEIKEMTADYEKFFKSICTTS